MEMKNRNFPVIFLYEFKLGHNAAQATRNINEDFGDNAADERMVQRWFKKFKSGDTKLENEERGRPTIVVDDDHWKALIEANPRTTV